MRILLSTFGTAGDIIPFARLASALLPRGHQVTVHSWEHYREWLPAAAAFVPAAGGVVEAEVDETLDWALRAPSFPEQVRRFGRLFYGLGRGTARALAYHARAREVFAGHDLALINALDHLGQATAEKLGLPWVCYTSRPPPDIALADPLYAGIDAEVTTLVAEVTGQERRVRVFREASPLLTLAACSAQLAGPAASPKVRLTGGWLEPVSPQLPSPPAAQPQPLPPAVERFVAAGPCLLVTFGTMPDTCGRTAALVAAAAASGWRALVQVLPPASPPARVPEGMAIVGERLPFASLLPRVTAVVHHGSVGTCHEIVRAGRPSLVVPHMGDQFYWGNLLCARGLGPAPVHTSELRGPRATTSFASLRAAGCRRAAEEFAARLAEEDGVSDAVAQLEALAAGATP